LIYPKHMDYAQSKHEIILAVTKQVFLLCLYKQYINKQV
jgi:hypothetical protein